MRRRHCGGSTPRVQLFRIRRADEPLNPLLDCDDKFCTDVSRVRPPRQREIGSPDPLPRRGSVASSYSSHRQRVIMLTPPGLKLDPRRLQPCLGHVEMVPLRALDVIAVRAEAALDNLAFYTPPLDEDVRFGSVLGTTLHRIEYRALPCCQFPTTYKTRVRAGGLGREITHFEIRVTLKLTQIDQN